MLRYLLGILTGLAVPPLLIVLFLVVLPKMQSYSDAYAKIPAFVVSYPVLYGALAGDFGLAARALNRQATVAEGLGLTDQMRVDLVENTRYVMDRARYTEHYEDMLPWLERLSGLAQHQYLAQLMLAEAKAFSRPRDAVKAMLEVREAAPNFDRAYRPVIEAYPREVSSETISDWCQRYATAQVSGFGMFFVRPITAEGQNIGDFVLELRNANHDLILIPHEGFKLNERRQYTFEIVTQTEQAILRLHFPTLPGFKVVIRQVSLAGPNSDTSYQPDEMSISSRYGFFLDPSTTIASSFSGDVLTFAPLEGTFAPSESVTFDLEIRRLALSNHPKCQEFANNK
ncbi:MAG: hypothetical protein HQ495_11335 [Alphaproteobacteria bacterium]|nr:hypothetical protein [Alphaproteobacteria bacterium]